MNVYSWSNAEDLYYVFNSLVQLINSFWGFGLLLAFIIFILFSWSFRGLSNLMQGSFFLGIPSIFVLIFFIAVGFKVKTSVNIVSKCSLGTAYTINDVPYLVAVPVSVVSYLGFTFADMVSNTLYSDDNFKRVKKCDKVPQDFFVNALINIEYPLSSEFKILYDMFHIYSQKCVNPLIQNNPNYANDLYGSKNFIQKVTSEPFSTQEAVYFEFCSDSNCSSKVLKNCSEASEIINETINNSNAILSNFLKQKFKLSSTADVFSIINTLDSAYIKSGLTNQSLINNLAVMKMFDIAFESYAKKFGIDSTQLSFSLITSIVNTVKDNIQNGALNRLGNLVKGDAFLVLSIVVFPIMFFYAIAMGRLTNLLSWIEALIWVSMFPVMIVIIDYFAYKSTLPIMEMFNQSFSYYNVVNSIDFLLKSQEYSFWNSAYVSIPMLAWFIVKGVGTTLYDFNRGKDTSLISAGSTSHGFGASGVGLDQRPTQMKYNQSYLGSDGQLISEENIVTAVPFGSWNNTSIHSKITSPTGNMIGESLSINDKVAYSKTTTYDPMKGRVQESIFNANDQLLQTHIRLSNEVEQPTSARMKINRGEQQAKALNNSLARVQQIQEDFVSQLAKTLSAETSTSSQESKDIMAFYGGDKSALSKYSHLYRTMANIVTDKAKELGYGADVVTQAMSSLMSSAGAYMGWGTDGTLADTFTGLKTGLKLDSIYKAGVNSSNDYRVQNLLRLAQRATDAEEVSKAINKDIAEQKRSGREAKHGESFTKAQKETEKFAKSNSEVQKFSKLYNESQGVTFTDGKFVANESDYVIDINKLSANLSKSDTDKIDKLFKLDLDKQPIESLPLVLSSFFLDLSKQINQGKFKEETLQAFQNVDEELLNSINNSDLKNILEYGKSIINDKNQNTQAENLSDSIKREIDARKDKLPNNNLTDEFEKKHGKLLNNISSKEREIDKVLGGISNLSGIYNKLMEDRKVLYSLKVPTSISEADKHDISSFNDKLIPSTEQWKEKYFKIGDRSVTPGESVFKTTYSVTLAGIKDLKAIGEDLLSKLKIFSNNEKDGSEKTLEEPLMGP